MEKTEGSLKRKVAVGAIWMILLKVVLRSIGLISTLILARILSPDDYGMVAIAMSAYALLEMFAAFGFDTALVKKDKLLKEDYDSAWTARLICYVILALIFILSATYIEAYYKKEGIVPIIYALSIMMIFSGVENIAIVDFRRNLQFSKEFKLNVTIKIIGFTVTIPLAFYLQNYWALIIGSISGRFSSVLIGYYLRPYKPSICFKEIKSILNFSKWILLTNFTLYFRTQTANLVLGRFAGVDMVGAYSLSAELSRVSTQELIAAMNRSVYSGYSKFSEDKKSLYLNFLKVLGVQSFLIFPMGFIVAALSENVVLIILGSKWTDVIYPLSMMAMSTALVSVTSSIQYLYFVINKPRLGFYMSIVGLTIYLPQAIFMGIDKGLIGLVHAHFNTSIVMAVGNLLFVSYVFKEHVNRIITTIYRQLFSSLFTYLAISSYIKPLIESTYDSLLIASLILGVISILIYISFIFLLWVIGGKPDSAESIAISLLTSFRKRIKASV